MIKVSTKFFVTHAIITNILFFSTILSLVFYTTDFQGSLNDVTKINATIINKFDLFEKKEKFVFVDKDYWFTYHKSDFNLHSLPLPHFGNVSTEIIYDDLLVFGDEFVYYGCRYKNNNDKWFYQLCRVSIDNRRNKEIIFTIGDTEEPFYAVGGFDEYVYISSTNVSFKFNLMQSTSKEEDAFDSKLKWIQYQKQHIEKINLDKKENKINSYIAFKNNEAFIEPKSINYDFEAVLLEYDFCMESYYNFLHMNKSLIVYKTVERKPVKNKTSIYLTTVFDWNTRTLSYNSLFYDSYDNYQQMYFNFLSVLDVSVNSPV